MNEEVLNLYMVTMNQHGFEDNVFETLENMCPKDKRLFVRFEKLEIYLRMK